MPKILGSVSEEESTDDYASVLKVKIPEHFNRIIVDIKENDTDEILWKVLGSLDDVTYHTIKAESELAQDGFARETTSDPWIYIDVQIKSATEDEPGLATINIAGG